MHDPFEGYFGSDKNLVGSDKKVKSLEIALDISEVRNETPNLQTTETNPPPAVENQNSSPDAAGPSQLYVSNSYEDTTASMPASSHPSGPQATIGPDPEELRRAELRRMATSSFSARRENSTFKGMLRKSPVIFFIFAAVLSLGAGAAVAHIYSQSALKKEITEVVSQKKIISNVAVMLRDETRLKQLDSKEKDLRSSITYKTGAIWFIISAIVFGIYSRFVLN